MKFILLNKQINHLSELIYSLSRCERGIPLRDVPTRSRSLGRGATREEASYVLNEGSMTWVEGSLERGASRAHRWFKLPVELRAVAVKKGNRHFAGPGRQA